MAENFKNAIKDIIDTASNAPTAKEATTMVITKIAEQIALYREDPAALQLLAEKLKTSLDPISTAVAETAGEPAAVAETVAAADELAVDTNIADETEA